MTQRQHDSRVALRRATHIHGPESNEARLAAIEFCYARKIDPHFRYPKAVPLSSHNDFSKPLDIDVYSETEWQRLVNHFTKTAPMHPLSVC